MHACRKDTKYLTPEQHVPVEELKLSLVEGFEKRVVYKLSKAFSAESSPRN